MDLCGIGGNCLGCKNYEKADWTGKGIYYYFMFLCDDGRVFAPLITNNNDLFMGNMWHRVAN